MCHGRVRTWAHRDLVHRAEPFVADPKQERPHPPHHVREAAEPYTSNKSSSQPDEDIRQQVGGHVAGEDVKGQGLWHARRVQLGESKRGFAQFAVFLLRMRQPFHQAVLVNILDASAAFARVEERFAGRGFASTYPARVDVSCHRVGRVGGRGRSLVASPEGFRAYAGHVVGMCCRGTSAHDGIGELGRVGLNIGGVVIHREIRGVYSGDAIRGMLKDAPRATLETA